MPDSKRICVDVAHKAPISKEDLLKLIKKELDKEFPTDVVAEHSRITVTLNQLSARPPQKGKK